MELVVIKTRGLRLVGGAHIKTSVGTGRHVHYIHNIAFVKVFEVAKLRIGARIKAWQISTKFQANST